METSGKPRRSNCQRLPGSRQGRCWKWLLLVLFSNFTLANCLIGPTAAYAQDEGQVDNVSHLADAAGHDDHIPTIVLFTGSTKHNPFWDLLIGFMGEVSDDLKMQVHVKFARGSRKRMISQVREVCRQSDPPDAIVIQGFKRTGPDILRIANRHGIPIFLTNSGLTDQEKAAVGQPRTKLKNWIGELLPNDKDAGQQLARTLIEKARQDPARLGPDGKVHVIALNGEAAQSASIERQKGLVAAIEQEQDAVLDQLVAVDWDREFARKRCRFLLRRYPHVSVIWSASDLMALGAIEAVREQGLVPGKDVIIGGVDATPEALALIEDGVQYATVGGHFKDGGWVAILLHDYLKGADFEPQGTQYDSRMTLILEDNLEAYRSEVTRSAWEKTDFKTFSRHFATGMKDYPFRVEARPKEPTSK